MKLSAAMKKFAEKNLGVKAGSKEPVYFNAVAKAVQDGKLTGQQAKDLRDNKEITLKKKTNPKKPAPAPDISGMFKEFAKEIATAIVGAKEPAKPAPVVDKRTKEEKAVDLAVDKKMQDMGLITKEGRVTPTELFSKAAPFLKQDSVRVKSATEDYSKERATAHWPAKSGLNGKGSPHPYAGRPASYDNRPLYHGSQLDKAISGAYVKLAIESSTDIKHIPRQLRMTDHDRDLMNYALHECEWTGLLHPSGENPGTEDYGTHPINRRRLNEMEIKGILDDTISGGLEAAPIVFDDMVILTPLLYGELFPFVNVVNITRGRRIEGFSIGNPTFTSGVAEGATITPFNTSQFVLAFDTSIFVETGAMEIGLDLEEDSPADIGGIVAERYGLQAMARLDYLVAVGDGVTQMQGLVNAPSSNLINADNNVGGPPTVGDYEGLMFGIQKAFRKEPGAVIAFVGSDVSYRRARGIPVGPTDERRVFGMTEEDYMLFGLPYKVQNDIPNGTIICVNLKRYRCYRRLGFNMRVETQGNYLTLRNLKLLVMRFRFGGQLELPGAMSILTDGQS